MDVPSAFAFPVATGVPAAIPCAWVERDASVPVPPEPARSGVEATGMADEKLMLTACGDCAVRRRSVSVPLAASVRMAVLRLVTSYRSSVESHAASTRRMRLLVALCRSPMCPPTGRWSIVPRSSAVHPRNAR